MDKNYLETIYDDACKDLKEHSKYRLNFGVYYTPRFVGGK